VARRARRILGNLGWALAHAVGARRSWRVRRGLHQQLGYRRGRFDLGRRGLGLGKRASLVDADAVALGLISAVLPAVGSGPVALASKPDAPAASGFAAVQAAIPCLGVARQEPAFATFKQAPAAARVPTVRAWQLTGRQPARKLRMAHGRDCSRAVKRREASTSRRHFAPRIWGRADRNKAAATSQTTRGQSRLPGTGGDQKK